MTVLLTCGSRGGGGGEGAAIAATARSAELGPLSFLVPTERSEVRSGKSQQSHGRWDDFLSSPFFPPLQTHINHIDSSDLKWDQLQQIINPFLFQSKIGFSSTNSQVELAPALRIYVAANHACRVVTQPWELPS